MVKIPTYSETIHTAHHVMWIIMFLRSGGKCFVVFLAGGPPYQEEEGEGKEEEEEKEEMVRFHLHSQIPTSSSVSHY